MKKKEREARERVIEKNAEKEKRMKSEGEKC
jgi:hypothetical protein